MRCVIVAAALVLGTVLPWNAAAAPIPSAIVLIVDKTFPLTPNERDTLAARLTKAVEFNRQKSTWQCVEAPIVAPSMTGGDKRITFGLMIVPDSARQGDAIVRAEVSLLGKLVGAGTVTVNQTMLDDDRLRALGDGAVQAMNDAVAAVKPCAPAVKMKSKTTIHVLQTTIENSSEGEARIALMEDGSFTGAVAITGRTSDLNVASPVGPCTAAAVQYEDTYDLAGHYDANDGTLKFTRLQSRGQRQTNRFRANCTINGYANSAGAGPAPAAPPGENMADRADVRIALQDNARTVIPMPPYPGVTGEFTIDLVLDRAAAVARLVPSPDARGSRATP